MGHEKDHDALKSTQVLSFWISFTVVCILCVLLLVQRIRRRHLGRYAPLERQMDPRRFSFGEKERRGGDEELAGLVGHGVPYYPADPSTYGVAGLPSACDILLPLSRSTHLPSSGYLAAVLGRERSVSTAQSYQQIQAPYAVAPSELSPSSGDSRSSTAGRSNRLLRSGSLGSCIETADRPVGSQTLDVQEFSGMAAPERTCSVLKRNQVVHHLYDVDEGGVRTYKRTMLQYN
ncbi:hypothetical protein ABOM_002400 [Aspergillus bombycis]|uniref:Uncharacterized protein n=1 Tax=Aspergillus bombycis TaxID=109264 RepID=A0A1F8AA00_9EURO|nr:hypothetical protein ABOM_002400 [Aspergillus bombycis]OGM48553.1 hypothetical protein ABOM_002400 [Aspergillus bombycis]